MYIAYGFCKSLTQMFIYSFIEKVLIIHNVPYCGLGIMPGTGNMVVN